MCSHFTPRTKNFGRTDGRTCDWLVTRRWSWVDEHLLPSLSALILATSRLLTVDDQTSSREHDFTNDVYDSTFFSLVETAFATITADLGKLSPYSRVRTHSRQSPTTSAKSKCNTTSPVHKPTTTVFLIPFFPSTTLPSDRDRQSDTRVRPMARPQHGIPFFSPSPSTAGPGNTQKKTVLVRKMRRPSLCVIMRFSSRCSLWPGVPFSFLCFSFLRQYDSKSVLGLYKYLVDSFFPTAQTPNCFL